MAKLIYKNERGGSLTFGDRAPFLVTAIDGLGSPQNIINKSTSYGQDGSTVTSSNLSDRNLVLEGVILEPDLKARQGYRRTLLEVFNPKLKGELIYVRDEGNVVIPCVPELAPFFPSNMQQNYQVFSLQLMAPNPYWLSEDSQSTEMVSWIGGFSFPLRLPSKFATAGEREINIINSGDVKTPVKLEIYGVATNPTITNTSTGEFIKVNTTLLESDVLTITTEFGNKKVERNGESVFHFIDLNSTFFELEVGDNVLEFKTEDVEDEANIKISYRNRYIGV